MRPFVLTICLVMSLAAGAEADFVLSFDTAKIERDIADQEVDLYLTSTSAAQIQTLFIRAYIGSTVVPVVPGDPSSRRGTEGNFQNAAYPGGFETAPLWNSSAVSLFEGVYRANVTHMQLTPLTSVALVANQPVKVGTFHIDTTGFSAPSLTITLDDPHQLFSTDTIATRLQTAPSPERPRGGTSYIFGSGLTVPAGSGSFAVASTPEPASLGIAGLGVTAGIGWLRSRNRRRRSAA